MIFGMIKKVIGKISEIATMQNVLKMVCVLAVFEIARTEVVKVANAQPLHQPQDNLPSSMDFSGIDGTELDLGECQASDDSCNSNDTSFTETSTQCQMASESECPVPTGNWIDSCHKESLCIEKHESTDPIFQKMDIGFCALKVDCPRERTDHGPKHNELMYPNRMQLREVENRNGSLTQNGKSISAKKQVGIPEESQENAPKSSADAVCQNPPGSYLEDDACVVLDLQPYQSSDPKVNQQAQACQAVLKCRKVERADKNGKAVSEVASPLLVYFNYEAVKGTSNKIENCDGLLKIGPDDRECYKKKLDIIESIAKREGQDVVVLAGVRPSRAAGGL